MRKITRVLAATMFLVTAWTALSLSVQSASAFPPSPCDWLDDSRRLLAAEAVALITGFKHDNLISHAPERVV